MWTVEQRQAHDRAGLRYPSDLTDTEWALVAPFIPPAKRGGRKRTVDVRAVLDGILYVLATGCQWRALPKDLPPRSTVHDYLTLWARDGTLKRLHHALFVQARGQAGKDASPTAAPGGRDEGLDQRPLGIGEVARVAQSRALMGLPLLHRPHRASPPCPTSTTNPSPQFSNLSDRL